MWPEYRVPALSEDDVAERQPRPPALLREAQERFAALLRSRARHVVDTADLDVSLPAPDAELLDLLAGDSDTKPRRLGIYRRQYWFRLLGVLQEQFPLLLRLMGFSDFVELCLDELSESPPRGAQLLALGRGLPARLESRGGEDAVLLRQCAELELALEEIFYAERLEPLRIDPSRGAELLTEPLRLQPAVRLFREDWELVATRTALRRAERTGEEEPGWPDASEGHWVLWRDANDVTRQQPLEPLAFALLGDLARGSDIASACARLGEHLAPEAEAFVSARISGWFANWAESGWLARA